MTSQGMIGIDFHIENANSTPPTVNEFDSPEELYKWFHGFPPSDGPISIRIICVRVDLSSSNDVPTSFKVPLPPEVVEHAIWKPEVYYNLANNPAGGAAGLTDDPWRFILQTPLDGGPFLSLAMSRRGIFVKGILFHDSAAFNPVDFAGDVFGQSAWRAYGTNVIALPHKFLQTHCLRTSRLLAQLIARVKDVEATLAAADQTRPDFAVLGRTLHGCNAELIDLERRSRFEVIVIQAIETIIAKTRHGVIPWPQLMPQQTAVASRSFDFESLPRRIENTRTNITDLIQQRNAQLNLRLTQASFRIAEATLSDSRSMKTIAIMTMILLPATAVASLFSMNMFDWSAEKGSQIASKWLWIYFVVTIPLTITILTIWWMWNRRSIRQNQWWFRSEEDEQGRSVPFQDTQDPENGGTGSTDSIEMQARTTKKRE